MYRSFKHFFKQSQHRAGAWVYFFYHIFTRLARRDLSPNPYEYHRRTQVESLPYHHRRPDTPQRRRFKLLGSTRLEHDDVPGGGCERKDNGVSS